MSSGVPVKARLARSGVEVLEDEGAAALSREGYGVMSGGVLRLSPVETLYLAYRGRLLVEKDGEVVPFDRLVALFSEEDEMIWVRFAVYHDLRLRGRRVSRGPSPHSLVYTGPGGERVEVYVLEESRMTSLSEIMEYIDESVRNDRVPVLAIVDRHGDVTYYALNRFQPGGG
jgi:tRNA-intron endonuclease